MAKKFSAREISIALNTAMIDEFGKTAFAIVRNLIFASPVGNPDLWQNPKGAPEGYVGGHFRRNWVVSEGGFVGIDEEDAEEVDGVDTVGAVTLALAKSQIDQYTRASDLGPGLVIANNVPYANRLANGWSVQAEEGWVDTAIDLGLGIEGGKEDLP